SSEKFGPAASSPLRPRRNGEPGRSTTWGAALSSNVGSIATDVFWRKCSISVLAPVENVAICGSAIHGGWAGSTLHGSGYAVAVTRLSPGSTENTPPESRPWYSDTAKSARRVAMMCVHAPSGGIAVVVPTYAVVSPVVSSPPAAWQPTTASTGNAFLNRLLSFIPHSI